MDQNQIITKHYNCRHCGKTHEVKLNRSICENRSRYPFPYVFLHDSINGGEFKELLTILYIDKDLQIRGSDIQILGDNNLFSKEQVISMTKPLMEEIELLREEVVNLTKKLNNFKKGKD